MSGVAGLVMAAIAGINALKERDAAKRRRQEDINAAEEKMWNDHNDQIRAKIAAMNGQDPNEGRFARSLELFKKGIDENPMPDNWMPLVNAAAQGGAAAYDISQTPSSTPAAPSGRDVPGKNFSAAPNYTPAVNYSEWKPVNYTPEERPAGGGNIRGLADKYDEEDANQWWRR